MSKREREAENDHDRPPKRSRADHQPPAVEEIHYARQLQQFLIFRQDGIQQLRNGIASFKNFLEIILYHRDEESRARQISILREYLESQKPEDPKNTEQPLLAQLWQAWSFANQNNNDHLASSVSAIFALLLKTLSGELALREHGIFLCRTVLQHQHLRLLKRCLDAPKHKDFLISPCLRLITEVATFDGGALAAEIYRKRESTFDVSTIRRCLGLVKLDISEEDAKRRPSIRTLTMRYVTALLKYLSPRDKIDLLKSKAISSAIFQFLRDDPADIVIEILHTAEQSVLKDPDVVRSSKAALLTSQNLEKVTEVATRSAEDHPAAGRAFAWLKAVCTNTSYGILRSSGWYPVGTTSVDHAQRGHSIDLGLESIDFYDRPKPIEVRNPTLLSWIFTLRSHNNVQERELLLSCFAAAPELVAAYFADRNFQLDPKLSNTWIAYASLLFEIVNLPVPTDLGNVDENVSMPPQTAILVENILPRPLTQQILTRCLNQNSELVTFFAVRILVLAFDKFGSIVTKLRSHRKDEQALWTEAADRLQQRFVDRIPAMKDVIQVFRKLPDDAEHALQREAVSRLLQLYYLHTPLRAFEEQFDVSSALATAFMRDETTAYDNEDEASAIRKVELQHLLVIAQHSTGMKWFHKQGGLAYSPFVTLLRIHRKELNNALQRDLVKQVLVESGLLNAHNGSDQPLPTDALLGSIADLSDDSVVWTFLDDLLGRGIRKPVKYVDDLEQLSREEGSELPSVLSSVIMEQASFVKAGVKSESQRKATWVKTFFGLLVLTSDMGDVLQNVVEKVSQELGLLLPKASKDLEAILTKVRPLSKATDNPTTRAHEEAPQISALSFPAPPAEPTSHPELSRWSQKDIDLAIEDGDISALILDLCSTESDIRRQSYSQLTKLRHKLSTSTSTENHSQISLLVGELLETFSLQYLPLNHPLPYLGGTFAVRALHIQTQPAHFMYPKLNRFLMRGPEWKVGKLPAYWLANTSLSLPEEDDAFWKEVAWVLEWLVDGLRSEADLDILRRGEIFEKVMGMWMSPAASGRNKSVKEKITELLYRATCIEGGSNVLVTRAGVLSWLDMVRDGTGSGSGGVQEAMRDRILQTGDRERLKAWTGMKRGVL